MKYAILLLVVAVAAYQLGYQRGNASKPTPAMPTPEKVMVYVTPAPNPIARATPSGTWMWNHGRGTALDPATPPPAYGRNYGGGDGQPHSSMGRVGLGGN